MEFNFDLATITWEGVSAIVSCLMIFFTLISLIQNRIQMKEIRKQWKEDSRARIVLSIVADRMNFYLKVSNVGKETAYDVSLEIEDEYINNLLFDHYKKVFVGLRNPFVVEAGKSKYYSIAPIHLEGSICTVKNETLNSDVTNEWLKNNIHRKFSIFGKYCKRYNIEESFSIDDFFNGSMIVDDRLTESIRDLAKASVVHNNNYMPIQKSLDIIAKELQKISKQNEQSNK